MKIKPYKFLDAFEKSDYKIFFGREKEINEIHSRIYFSNLLVLYGPSGTGKTSTLKCGLANRMPDSDWKPIYIRKNQNILESTQIELQKTSLTAFKKTFNIEKKIRSVYLDYLTPIYLIYDQLEELFIFGDEKEINDFISFISSIIKDSENNVKVIFIIREEYLADLSSFEYRIPEILDNRFRIERMGRSQLIEAIKRPAQICDVQIDDGIPEVVVEKISDNKGNVELTYIQLLMDYLYKIAESRDPERIFIQSKDLERVGHLGNLISDFLDNQLKKMENSKTGEDILKTLISLEGTKRPMRVSEIRDSLKQLNIKVSPDTIINTLQYFVKVRILREKDENGFYELRHDSLALIIFEKMSLLEKEIIEINQFLNQAFERFNRRKILLSQNDLNYIAPYENRLYPKKNIKTFLQISKDSIQRKIQQKRRLVFFSIVSIIVILSGFTFWAMKERKIAVEQKISSENHRKIAEKAKISAENAYMDALDSIYVNILASLAISPDNMNVLFKNIWNPLSISVSGIPPENIKPVIRSNNALLRGNKGNYEIKPFGNDSIVSIAVAGNSQSGDSLDFGNKEFRVKSLPDPRVSIAKKYEGTLSLEDIRNNHRINVAQSEFYFKGIEYKIISFKIGFMDGSVYEVHEFPGDTIPKDFITHLENSFDFSIPAVKKVFFQDIYVKSNYKKELIKLPVLNFDVIPHGYSLSDIRLNDDIIKLIHASQEVILSDPYSAYRYAEAAFIADPSRSNVIRNFIEIYRYTFSDPVKRFGFDSKDKILFSFDLKHLLRLYGNDNNLNWQLFSIKGDSINKIAEQSHNDANFMDNGYNAFMSENYFMISRLIKSPNSKIMNLFSLYDLNGNLLKNDLINQLSLFTEMDETGDYFLSIPNTQNIISLNDYDSRATLWSKDAGKLNYLWGNKSVNYINANSTEEYFEIIGHATFNHNSSIIASCDNANSKIHLFNTENGSSIKEIDLKIAPKKAIITPKMDIIYFAQSNIENQYNQIIIIETSNQPQLFIDSVFSFSYARNGKYFLVSKADKNDKRISTLYDYHLNILQSFPTDLPNGIIKIDHKNEFLYHLMTDKFGRPHQQIILPLSDSYNRITQIVNDKKFYGSVPFLKMKDLQKFSISTETSKKILDSYQD